ncbi:MAG: autotransporter-associated beta strand repeat-containing protein [Verrucomicrobiota bacterium]
MKNKKAGPYRNLLVVVVAVGGLISGSLQATTVYWDSDVTGTGNNVANGLGLGGTGNWNAALLNWWPGSGTTDQAWVNANNDTAAFWGATAGTVTLTAPITVGGLQFNTNAYSLVSTATNILTFGAADNTITLDNLATATITGTVAGTGNVTLAGGVANGSVTAGTLNLNGTSTTGWSGTTTLNNGVTVSLFGNNQALVGTSGINLNGGGIMIVSSSTPEAALNRIADAAPITSNGGTFTVTNKPDAGSVVYAETIGTVTLTSGLLKINSTQAASTATSQSLTLGGLTPTGAGTVAFGVNGLTAGGLGTVKNKINVTGLASTAANQIIGPWATIGNSAASQTDFAVNNINVGTVNAFGIQGAGIAGSAETTWTAATDSYTQSTTPVLLTDTRTITSLRNTATNALTMLDTGSLEAFGLLNAATTTWTIDAIEGSIRQPGTAAANLYVTTGAGPISIYAPITDNTGALTLVKSGTGGNLTLYAANTYTGSTVVNAGTLQFARQIALYNNTPASWTAANLVVAAGATAVFNVGGFDEFTASDIDTLKVLGTATSGFKSSSSLGLDTTNAFDGEFSYDSSIANTNGGANVLGLTKLGNGNLTLSAAQTYTGPTTIQKGSLTLSGGNDRLATSGTVIFGGTPVTLALGANDQALAALATGNVTTAATVTGTGTLTLNGGFVQIGGTSGTQTVDMTGLSNFFYSNPSGTLNVGGANNNSAELTLTGNNVITAGTLGVVTTGPSGNPQTGKIHLGQTNTINAALLHIGGLAGNGTLDFQSGLTAPTLKIRGVGGTDADRASVIIGSSSGFAAVGSTFAMGTGVLDAKISSMLIGESTRAANNPPVTAGTFTMSAGSLDATSITVGKNIAGSGGNAGGTGTFNQNGGSVTAGTLTIANRVAAGTSGVFGNYNFNSGTLNVSTINTGTGGNGTFTWADGILANNSGANQTVALISVFNLTNTGNTSGTHKWDVGGAQTSTVSAYLRGDGSLTKSNTGTLTLQGANTQTGSTTVSDGRLIAGFDGASTTLSNVAVTVVANNATMTLASGSLANGQRVVLNAVTAPTGLATGTTAYFVVNASGDTFQVSTTLGGTAITPTSAGLTVTVSRAGAFGSANSDIVLGDAGTTTLNGSPSLLTGGAFTIERGVTIANQATGGTCSIGGNSTSNSTFAGLVTANKSFTVSQVTGAGTLNITGGITGASAGTKTVTFNNVGAVNVSSTGISNGVTGNVAVTQSGIGTTTLSAGNSYTGDTTVNAGVLAVNGNSIANTNKLVINGGKVAPTGTEVVNTLFFGGVQQASGTWGATDSGATHIDNTRFSGTAGVVSVISAPGASGYATWASANADNQESNLDFDLDGVSNGVEYFMGLTGSSFTANPGIGAGDTVTWLNGGNIPSAAYGTQFKVQTSPDLTTWTDVLSGNPNLNNTSGSVKYTLPTGAGKLFTRLVVTPN